LLKFNYELTNLIKKLSWLNRLSKKQIDRRKLRASINRRWLLLLKLFKWSWIWRNL